MILGPPGTGKTTTILNEIDRLLSHGVDPSEIGFYSFTRAACEEAKNRAADRFGLDPDGPDLANFRTIHSQAFRLIGKDHGAVMKDASWQAFAEWARCRFTPPGVHEPTDNLMLPALVTEGDKLRHVYDLARLCRCSISKAMLRAGTSVETMSVDQVERFARKLEEYKRSEKLIEFVDMLTIATKTARLPSVRFAFFDEAQDNCKVQFELVEHWAIRNPRCERVTIVGDDDQAIYCWSGASPDLLIEYTKKHPTRVLEQSWRIPASVHRFAQRIIAQNRDRLAKVYRPKTEAGAVTVSTDVESVLDDCAGSDEEIMLLCRNIMFAGRYREECMRRGLRFRCEVGEAAPLQSETARDAFLAMGALLRRKTIRAVPFAHMLEVIPSKIEGERILPHGVKEAAKRNETLVDEARAVGEFKLASFIERARAMGNPFELFARLPAEERSYMAVTYSRDPTLAKAGGVTITTMHRSKGRQADTVILSSDVSSATHREMMDGDREGENRVAYVAATRAKKRLAIVRPSRSKYYDYERFVGGAA